MGWQDRAYNRDDATFGPSRTGGGSLRQFRPKTVVGALIMVNVALFVFTAVTARGRGFESSPLLDWFALVPGLAVEGQIWRIWTATYLHWSPWHLLMNMVGLYFLGPSLETHFGSRKFFTLYTLAGLAGSVLYVGLALLHWFRLDGISAGASGSVLGLMGAAAVLFPQAQVMIFPLPIPLRMKTVALICGGMYVLNLVGGGRNAGGDAAHIAGLLYGAWAGWRYRTMGISSPFSRRTDFWARIRKKVRSKQVPRPITADFQESEVDEILRKVGERGIHSLSDREKKILLAATDRKRRG